MKRLDPDKEYPVPAPHSVEEAMLFQLYDASTNWYTTKNPEYIKQYHDLYYALRSRGWSGIIDVDAKLPDNLMPEEYFGQASAQQPDNERPSITLRFTLENGTDNQEVLKALRETLDKVGAKEVMLAKTSA